MLHVQEPTRARTVFFRAPSFTEELENLSANSNSNFTEEKIDGLQIFADSTVDATEKVLLSRLHVGMRAKLAVGA